MSPGFAAIVLALLGLYRGATCDDSYLIGTGRYDVTGPAAEIEMVRGWQCSHEWCCRRLWKTSCLATSLDNCCVLHDMHGRGPFMNSAVLLDVTRLGFIYLTSLGHSLSSVCSCTHLPQMGYAMPTQIGHGIHFRQWSRAFIIATNSSRVVFVNVDICMGTQVLKMQVSLRLYTCTCILLYNVTQYIQNETYHK